MAEDVSIVVTGMGVISPLGRTTEEFWQALLRGTVATAPLTRFDTTMLSVERGAEVPDAQTGERGSAASLALEWAVEVAEKASTDAKLSAAGIDFARIGVSFGSVMGTRSSLDLGLLEKEIGHPSPARPPWGSPASLSRSLPGVSAPEARSARSRLRVPRAIAQSPMAPKLCDGDVLTRWWSGSRRDIPDVPSDFRQLPGACQRLRSTFRCEKAGLDAR